MSAFQRETKALSADASVVLDWVTGNTEVVMNSQNLHYNYKACYSVLLSVEPSHG